MKAEVQLLRFQNVEDIIPVIVEMEYEHHAPSQSEVESMKIMERLPLMVTEETVGGSSIHGVPRQDGEIE
jgi:hypothetical protein